MFCVQAALRPANRAGLSRIAEGAQAVKFAEAEVKGECGRGKGECWQCRSGVSGDIFGKCSNVQNPPPGFWTVDIEFGKVAIRGAISAGAGEGRSSACDWIRLSKSGESVWWRSGLRVLALEVPPLVSATRYGTSVQYSDKRLAEWVAKN